MALASEVESQIDKFLNRKSSTEPQKPFDLTRWKSELTEKADTNDCKEIVHTIRKFIESMISCVSYENYQQQTLFANKCFKLLEGIIKANWRNVFIENITKLIFDVIIEEDAEYWCIKKELLKVFNSWVKQANQNTRQQAVKMLSQMYLCKMVDNINSYGDYDLQLTIIECIFRMYGKSEINKRLKDLIPESEELSQTFADINPTTFDEDCRLFLNTINQNHEKIFSILCDRVQIGTIICEPPMTDLDGLWVDFNICYKAISWYYLRTDGSNEPFWELGTLFVSEIENYEIHRSHYKYCIHFILSGNLISSSEENSTFLNQAKDIIIILKRNEKAEKLVTSLLPDLLETLNQAPPKPTKKCSTAKMTYKSLNIKVSKLANKSLISQNKSEVSSMYNPLQPMPKLPTSTESKSINSSKDRTTNMSFKKHSSGSEDEVISIVSTEDPNKYLSIEDTSVFLKSQRPQILSGKCTRSDFSYRQIISSQRESDSIDKHLTPEDYVRNSIKVSTYKNQETNSSTEKWKTAEEGTSENYKKTTTKVLKMSNKPNLNKKSANHEIIDDFDSIKVNIHDYDLTESENPNKESRSKSKDRSKPKVSENINISQKNYEEMYQIRSLDNSTDFEERLICSTDIIPDSIQKTSLKVSIQKTSTTYTRGVDATKNERHNEKDCDKENLSKLREERVKKKSNLESSERNITEENFSQIENCIEISDSKKEMSKIPKVSKKVSQQTIKTAEICIQDEIFEKTDNKEDEIIEREQIDVVQKVSTFKNKEISKVEYTIEETTKSTKKQHLHLVEGTTKEETAAKSETKIKKNLESGQQKIVERPLNFLEEAELNKLDSVENENKEVDMLKKSPNKIAQKTIYPKRQSLEPKNVVTEKENVTNKQSEKSFKRLISTDEELTGVEDVRKNSKTTAIKKHCDEETPKETEYKKRRYSKRRTIPPTTKDVEKSKETEEKKRRYPKRRQTITSTMEKKDVSEENKKEMTAEDITLAKDGIKQRREKNKQDIEESRKIDNKKQRCSKRQRVPKKYEEYVIEIPKINDIVYIESNEDSKRKVAEKSIMNKKHAFYETESNFKINYLEPEIQGYEKYEDVDIKELENIPENIGVKKRSSNADSNFNYKVETVESRILSSNLPGARNAPTTEKYTSESIKNSKTATSANELKLKVTHTSDNKIKQSQSATYEVLAQKNTPSDVERSNKTQQRDEPIGNNSNVFDKSEECMPEIRTIIDPEKEFYNLAKQIVSEDGNRKVAEKSIMNKKHAFYETESNFKISYENCLEPEIHGSEKYEDVDIKELENIPENIDVKKMDSNADFKNKETDQILASTICRLNSNFNDNVETVESPIFSPNLPSARSAPTEKDTSESIKNSKTATSEDELKVKVTHTSDNEIRQSQSATYEALTQKNTPDDVDRSNKTQQRDESVGSNSNKSDKSEECVPVIRTIIDSKKEFDNLAKQIVSEDIVPIVQMKKKPDENENIDTITKSEGIIRLATSADKIKYVDVEDHREDFGKHQIKDQYENIIGDITIETDPSLPKKGSLPEMVDDPLKTNDQEPLTEKIKVVQFDIKSQLNSSIRTRDLNQTISTSFSGRKRKLYDPDQITVINLEEVKKTKKNIEQEIEKEDVLDTTIFIKRTFRTEQSEKSIKNTTKKLDRISEVKSDEPKTTSNDQNEILDVIEKNISDDVLVPKREAKKTRLIKQKKDIEEKTVKKNAQSNSLNFKTKRTSISRKNVTTLGIVLDEEKQFNKKVQKVKKLNATISSDGSRGKLKSHFEHMLDSWRQLATNGNNLIDYLNDSISKEKKGEMKISDKNMKHSIKKAKEKTRKTAKTSTPKGKRKAVNNNSLDLSDIGDEYVKRAEKYVPVSNLAENTKNIKEIVGNIDKYSKTSKILRTDRKKSIQKIDNIDLGISLIREELPRINTEDYAPVKNSQILSHDTKKNKQFTKSKHHKNEEQSINLSGQSNSAVTTEKIVMDEKTDDRDKIVIISNIELEPWNRTPLTKISKDQQDKSEVTEHTSQKTNVEETTAGHNSYSELYQREKKMCRMKGLMHELAPSWTATAFFNDKVVTIKSSDYIGKYLVLFFYPLDFGDHPYAEPPSEILAINNSYESFVELNTEVIGCSVDSYFTHNAWLKYGVKRNSNNINLNFPLLADCNHKISKAYMMYSEKLGHSFRGFYIMDPEGIIFGIAVADLKFPIPLDEILIRIKNHQSRNSI